MFVNLKIMAKKHMPAGAAAGLLLALILGATSAWAQGPMQDDDGIGTLPASYTRSLLAPADSGSTDPLAFGQTGDSATAEDGDQSQGQNQNQGQNGASNQDSPPANPSGLKVNPVTGLVSTAGAGYVPLTGEQRWKLYWKMNYLSIGAYFGPFFDAAVLDQATSSPYAWGGGLKGYSKRVGSRTASAMLQGTFQAPAAYLLHDDVRYITSTRPGFRHRVLHAIAYSFLTYNNSGRPTLNVANLAAFYGATAVTTAWLPGHYRVIDYTLSNSTAQIGLTVPVNVLQEFWPDITGWLRRR